MSTKVMDLGDGGSARRKHKATPKPTRRSYGLGSAVGKAVKKAAPQTRRTGPSLGASAGKSIAKPRVGRSVGAKVGIAKRDLSPAQFYPLQQSIIGSRSKLHTYSPAHEPRLTSIKKIKLHDAFVKQGAPSEMFKIEVFDPATKQTLKGLYDPGKAFEHKGQKWYPDAKFTPEHHGPSWISRALGPLAKAVGGAAHVVGSVNKATGGGGSDDTDPLQSAGITGQGVFTGKLGAEINTTLKKGALSAGSAVSHGLSIPGEQVRKNLGHSLGIRGEHVTGAELAEHFGLPKETGLLFDVSTDPLMFVGGGLAPAKGGAKLAQVLTRINHTAPEVLYSAAGKKALDSFAKHKDDVKLAKDLNKLFTKSTVRAGVLRRRTPIADEQLHASQKTVREALSDTPSFELHNTKRKLLKGGRKVLVTEKVRLPDQAGLDAVTQAMRSAHARQKAPQLNAYLMTPFGRRIGPRIPISPDLGRIPYRRMSKAQHAELLHTARARARAEIHTQRTADLGRIDEQLAAARLTKDKDSIAKLAALRAKTDREYATIGAASIKAAEEAVGHRGLITVGDRVSLGNTRRAMHAGKVSADEYGRTVQGILNRAYEKALRPIEGKNRQRSAERVRLYLEVEADTKGVGLHSLEEIIGKLTPGEKMAADNLRAVHSLEAEHLVRTGLMPREYVNKGYAGLRLYDHPAQAATTVTNEARQFAGTTAQLHQRSAAAFADISSEGALARKLTELADKPVTEESARALSRELWDNGALRAHAQLLARDIARSGPRDYESLNSFERHAANYGAKHGLDPHSDAPVPLFKTPLTHPEETEGQVVLHNGEHYGFDPEELATLPQMERSQAKLYSLVQDRQHLQQLADQAGASGRQDVAQELSAMRERLTEQIKHEDPESALHIELEGLAQHLEHNGFKANQEAIASEHDARISEVDDRLAELKAEQEAAPATADAVKPVQLKLTHFKVVKENGVDWVIEPATERAGKVFTPPPAAEDLAAELHGEYESKSEAMEYLKGGIEDHNASALEEPAAAVDHSEEIADLVKERKSLVAKRTRELRTREVEQEVKQAGVDLDTIPEGMFAKELDGQGTLWLRGAEDGTESPLEGMARHAPARGHYEAGPHDDPYDYVGHLPDFRATETEGVMLRLDPRESGYLRSKGHGLAASYKARFHAVDEIVGRDVSEARTQGWHTKDGEHSGDTSDLRPHFDHDGEIAYYTLRSDSDVELAARDVVIKPRTLLESEDKLTYLDPKDGTVWYFPRHQLPETMQLKSVGPERLWPAQALADFKREMVLGGELEGVNRQLVDEYRGLYDMGIHSGVQKYLSIARFGVTTPFPAYHVRNMVSDLIKSLQADSGVLFHPIANVRMIQAAYGRGLGKEITFAGYGKMKMEDFLFVTDMFGVRTGHHVAEVSQILKQSASGAAITESALKRSIHNSWFVPGGKSTKFGAKREDVVRFMTFAQRLRANGGDAADAAWYMTRHHFNFNDLRASEKQTMRNIFLFYTWYRKNIPLQLAELVRRPGFFSGLASLQSDLPAGTTPFNVGPFSGKAPDQPALPDYVKDKLGAMTTDWNGYALNVGFGAPWNDLEFLSQEGVQNLAILANPPISVASQLIFRQDPLTHRRFKDDETSGVADIISRLGIDLPRDKNGDPLLPWALNVILRQVPILGRGSYGLTGVSETRDQGQLQTLGNYLAPLTGLNVFVSPKPGSAREKYAIGQMGKATVGDRRTKLEDLSNLRHGTKDDLDDPELTDPRYRDALKHIDADALAEWTRRLGSRKAALRYLQGLEQSGYYEGQQRRRRGSGLNSGSGGLNLGSGGGGLG